ncbi:MAG: metallophosphoesterase family protein [Nitrospirales bacterium]
MATVAIGDIHGNLEALDDLLGRITPEVDIQDTVVFLGDYIDRGPNVKGCIDRILEFRSTTSAQVVTLLGNHEDWFLRTMRDPTRHSWLLGMEAFETIASYSTTAARDLRAAAEEAGLKLVTERIELPYRIFLELLPPSHVAFFEGLVLYHQTADTICVHGGLDPCIDSLGEQPREALLWGTDDFVEKYQGKDFVVYGHWGNAFVNSAGWPEPRIRNRTIGVDTIFHGVLSAIRMPDCKIIQSRRH